MKYCQRTLLRMVLCLLLVCSANVASAQMTLPEFRPTLVDDPSEWSYSTVHL